MTDLTLRDSKYVQRVYSPSAREAMAAAARRTNSHPTPARAEASRRNGRLGGRPRTREPLPPAAAAAAAKAARRARYLRDRERQRAVAAAVAAMGGI